MYDTMKNFILKLKADKRKRKRLGMALGALSLVVAICVSWQLRITGITMSDVPCCGLEEHVHTPECMDKQLICGLTEETVAETEPPAPELICELGEHSHGEECYQVYQELICDAAEHTHGDDCYTVEWVMDCTEDHEHGEECPQKEIKTLVCTQEEHTHGEGCYHIEKELICEEQEHTHGDGCYFTPEAETGHVHTDDCWEITYICGYDEEHTHTLACYSNPDADVETPSQWESTLPELTDDLAANLAAVAKSQVGYQESDDNFIVAEDGETRRGITRYGQWYGNPYGEWSAMFATFCLRYAGIDESMIPGNSGCYAWTAELAQQGLLLSPVAHNPAVGDLVFFDRDDDGTADHVGIVIRTDGPFFSAVEGGRDDRVEIYAYNRDDACVFGFVRIQNEEESTDPTEETIEETEPEELIPLALDVTVYEDGTFAQPVEGAVPMTISGLMPEGLYAKAYPVEYVLEGREVLWAFSVGVYREDGSLWESPEEPLVVTLTLPSYLDAGEETLEGTGEEAGEETTEPTELTEAETLQPCIYHVLPEGELEEIPTETAGELLAFEVASGETYASILPEPEPVEVILAVQFYEDETYEVPIEGAPEATVTGCVAETAIAKAYPAPLELPEKEVLWAFHLAVFNEVGEIIEPEALTASIQMPQMYAMDEETSISMYQVLEEGTEELLPSQLEENKLTFAAAKPAVYAAVREVLSDETALRKAATDGGEFELGNDLNIENDTVVVKGDLVLDLNGHILSATQLKNLFQVDGSLTIMDSTQAGVSVSEGNRVYASDAGRLANYADGSLTYYVTHTQVTDSFIGATMETRDAYTVSLLGRIEGGIQVNGGAFTLQSGAIIGPASGADDELTYDHLVPVSSAVSVTDGGTVNLDGGYICGSENGVHASGSTVHLHGTVLAANSASAIELYEDSTMIMTGGIISGNSAQLRTPSLAEGANGEKEYECGAGIYCSGSTAKVSGGYITNNRIDSELSNNNSYCGGAGVYVAHTENNSANFTLSGGYITGNYGPSGGGIHTVNIFGNATRTHVTMTGGFVSGNYASRGEGGGITLRKNTTAQIMAGHITNNETATRIDWGGGGIFCSQGAELAVKNALITENGAGGFGGGLTGCSTGVIRIGGEDSVAIYENWADGLNLTDGSLKQDDHKASEDTVFRAAYGYKDYYCEQTSTVSGIMLGGGDAQWHGSAKNESSESFYVTPEDFDPPLTADDRMGLTASPSQENIGKAQAAATVFINGNISYTHGGGILVNGITTFGSSFHVEKGVEQEITGVLKSLVDAEGNPLEMEEGQFTFLVTQADEEGRDTETVVSTGTNDAEGNIVFDKPLSCPGEGTYIFYIHERSSEDSAIIDDKSVYHIKLDLGASDKTTEGDVTIVQWRVTDFTLSKVNPDGKLEQIYHSPEWAGQAAEVKFDSLQFKNTEANEINFAVQKVWKDCAAVDYSVDGITVELVRDGEVIDTDTLTAPDWSGGWTNQPVKDSEDGHTYKYEVREVIPADGEGSPLFNASITYTQTGGDGELVKGYIPVTDPQPGQEYFIRSEDGKYFIVGQQYNEALSLQPPTNLGPNPYFTIEMPGSSAVFYPKNTAFPSFYMWYKYGGQWDPNYTFSFDKEHKSPFRLVDGYLVLTATQADGTTAGDWYLSYDLYQGSDAIRPSAAPSEKTFRLYTYGILSGGSSDVTATVTNTPIREEVFYGFDIKKVDADNDTILLPGAIFQLSQNGSVLSFSKVDGRYVYQSEESPAVAEVLDPDSDPTLLVTDENGQIRIDGLPAGTYILSELKPPDGYTVGSNEVQPITLPMEGNENPTIVVENTLLYYELPQTGGLGTIGFTFLGVLLMAASLGWWIYLQKRNREEGRAL